MRRHTAKQRRVTSRRGLLGGLIIVGGCGDRFGGSCDLHFARHDDLGHGLALDRVRQKLQGLGVLRKRQRRRVGLC